MVVAGQQHLDLGLARPSDRTQPQVGRDLLGPLDRVELQQLTVGQPPDVVLRESRWSHQALKVLQQFGQMTGHAFDPLRSRARICGHHASLPMPHA
ncbi:MAG: hypothetical protein R2719_02800 [Micropruina sp.]